MQYAPMDTASIIIFKHMDAYTTMSENLSMVEFDLKIPYSITSDGQPYLMAIKNEDIPST